MKILSAFLLSLLPMQANAQPLLVAAAADLAPLELALWAGMSKAAGVPVRFTFGSSGMLARQIRAGAPFDVYLSANEEFVNELSHSGFILPQTITRYAEGRLGLWSKSGKYRRLSDLRSKDCLRIALANPLHAPYGLAAEQTLKKFDIYQTIQQRLVFAENVRQAYEFGRSGNADAVITAWTLVHDKGGVLLPREHSPIIQAGGVVSGRGRATVAQKALAWLTSEEGKSVLGKFGLQVR